MQLLILLLFHAVMVVVGNGCHSDRDKDHRLRVNCSAAGFSDIPPGLNPETKVVLFPGNLFNHLSWSSFQVFSQIYEIDLTGNKVPEVTSSSGPVLPSLSVLRLGGNQLTTLSDGSFTACAALTELYLDNNAIYSLSNLTFSGLIKLEILDLSSNHIRVLPLLMLHPLPAIETLYLENNKISVLPDDWFSKKVEVPYLFLSANPWTCSCTLGYLRRYLEDYELNFYVRDGRIIQGDAESVVCASPSWHKDRPVITLEESELCSKPTGSLDLPMTTAASPSRAAPTDTPAELHTAYQVVTWSWFRSFSVVSEWSNHRSRGDGSQDLTANVQATTESPHVTTIFVVTNPPKTTQALPTTTEATTAEATTTEAATTEAATSVATATKATTTYPSWLIDDISSDQQLNTGAAGVFCFWLFAASVLLCAASATCTLLTVVRLSVWCRTLFKPLNGALVRRGGAIEGVRLVTYSKMEGVTGSGGVMALYRSVLFVSRDGGEAEDGGGRGETEEVTGRSEEQGIYRKTVYRTISKQAEIEGWRDVMEECWVPAEDRGREGKEERRGGGDEASRKRYSVILREEREEARGRREELDWVVGGWEVKKGDEGRGEDNRSSWGEWLVHYLPSMPWGVSTPAEGEAAQ